MINFNAIRTFLGLEYNSSSNVQGIEPAVCAFTLGSGEFKICCGAVITGAPTPWFLSSYHMFDSLKAETYQIMTNTYTGFMHQPRPLVHHDIMTSELTDEPTAVGPFGLSVPHTANLRDKLISGGNLEHPIDTVCTFSGKTVTLTAMGVYRDVIAEGTTTYFLGRLDSVKGHSGRVFAETAHMRLFVYHGNSAENIGLFSCLSK